MWYVIDADENASIVYGFKHQVTSEILRKSINGGNLDKYLQSVKVHKGDTYFVPAGTVHGIGKGILIAEIQESSNITYRVYDYNRIDKAVNVMNMKTAVDIKRKSRMIRYYPGYSREIICRCKYFEPERIQVKKAFSFSVVKPQTLPIIKTNKTAN